MSRSLRFEIKFDAPSEEIARRAMDEILDATLRLERKAAALLAGIRCMSARDKLVDRYTGTAKVLSQIADAIDFAKPTERPL